MVPYASLDDDNGDGWHSGSGFGIEMAYAMTVVDVYGDFRLRAGLAFRNLGFSEFEVGGVPSSVNDSLNVFYMFCGVEFLF